MTSDILVDILSYLEDLKVCERKDGEPTPFLIVDGHESRLSPNFIKYINNKETKWFVSIRVPYLTHFWQVADSDALNGAFKISWVREKRKLINF